MTDGRWPEAPPLVREAKARAGAIGLGRSCPDEVGRLFQVLAAQVRAGRIAELGTGTGVRAAWLASALDPGAELVTVEWDEALVERAASLFDELGNVTVSGGAWSALGALAPFPLLCCDAAAPEDEQMTATIELLEPGGTLVLDDRAGVGRADVTVRQRWLHHPHLVATDLPVSASESVVMGVRR